MKYPAGVDGSSRDTGSDRHAEPGPAAPSPTCDLCPRLESFRISNRALYPDFHNAPVPAFGPVDARVLVVGLAPGLKGANRSGRPFTGDYAGDLLYRTLGDFGFSAGVYAREADDGLTLVDCRIVNAVRCVPPANKPTGYEITTCRRFLESELATMKNLEIVVALGSIAHRAVVAALGLKQAAYPFTHGRQHSAPKSADAPGGLVLADSYHCSRYNTNTGRLTEPMFRDVFMSVRRKLDSAPQE